MTTTSNKASSVTKKASAVTLLTIVLIAGVIFAAPSLSMAQQQQQQTTTGTTGTATTAPTTAPLTPEEQRQQDRFVRITTAITQNLEQGQKQINGIVYTPRWSEPVWVQPNSLSLLFVYCLPGEFADSGQEILGGSELEVLESYSLAVTADLTGWLMIVENEHEIDRLPAAVGVICSSDANDPETRVLSLQEQIEINNIIRQFITVRNTVINNVTQIINIINNVTTNGTGCQLEIATNEETYTSGDNVTITVTNDDDEALEFSNNNLGLQIKNLDTDEMYPIISLQVITTLEPGESRTFGFTYEQLVSEIGTGTIEARVVGDGCPASTTFTLTNEITEPLRVQPELDPLDGNTAPASYLFEARTFGGTEPYTYLWDFGDGQQADTGNVYHTYENPGTYIVTVTVTDATGQNASGSLSPLNIAPPPTNDTGGVVTPEPLRAQANLDSTDIPFTHRFEANADGGTPPYTYHWDFGDGQEANVQNTRHTYDNPGTYTATLTVTDSAGQNASDSTEVIVQPEPPTGEPPTNDTGGQ
jgi:PKD repeat protein